MLVLPACTNNHLTIFQAREIDRNFVETIIKKNKKIFFAYISSKDKNLSTELETGEHAYFNSFRTMWCLFFFHLREKTPI